MGTPINQAFVGSCANGTLEDLALVAQVLEGRQVSPNVRFLVTPGSQNVYREALRTGLVAKLDDADPSAAAPKANKAPPPKPNSKLSQLGLTLGALDGDARTKFHVSNDIQGVVVTDVDPDSPAGEKNFRPGDVIVEVQSQAVRSPDDVARHLDADSKAGKKVEMLLVNRAGDLAYVALRLTEG